MHASCSRSMMWHKKALPGGITFTTFCSLPMSDSRSWHQHHLFPKQPSNIFGSVSTFSSERHNTLSVESILNPGKTSQVVGPSHLSSANGTPSSLATDLTLSMLCGLQHNVVIQVVVHMLYPSLPKTPLNDISNSGEDEHKPNGRVESTNNCPPEERSVSRMHRDHPIC